MDPDLDPDPTPDPTPFFIDFQDAKKNIFFKYFFRVTCSQAHHLQSKKLNFLRKFCVKMLFCRHYFSLLNTFMRKGKDTDPDPYLWLMDPDPGGPKTCGSFGSGSPTLLCARCEVQSARCWMRLILKYKITVSKSSSHTDLELVNDSATNTACLSHFKVNRGPILLCLFGWPSVRAVR